ncbi:hypothetical protein LUZ63_024128 [Rhynchospora breviuscula]|uniref:TIGR01777 family protein n=1 Tax=Rhynchospora breviuscula TaxID=2022672 RepID=A0A9P9Z2P3_9POAL|nr:hypothetical protein LUZ63_024128 [Rhynchospora breviuscula]
MPALPGPAARGPRRTSTSVGRLTRSDGSAVKTLGASEALARLTDVAAATGCAGNREVRMSVTSEATTAWKGSLFEGSGEVTFTSSGIGTYAVNWKARSEGSGSVTTPEELLAGAHSSCFSMALSNALAENGTPPESIDATASVTFKPGTGITGSHLNVNAVVPGLDAATRRLPESSARRVVLAGASGLIGSALAESLRADGVDVTSLVRHAPTGPHEVQWLQDATPLDPAVLAGARAVVCLNGASIGRFPWTRSYESTLLWSRITPTRTLASAIRALGDDAPALVNASATGYYGSQPGAVLSETSARGDGFLADICGEWESVARAAGSRARVAMLRTAPIVHERGVLKPLLLLTRLGVSGPIGRGTQVWPWITLDDEVRAIRHVIDSDLAGPVNLTGPTRATANDLGFALARRMNRPYVLRAPVWGMKLALGTDATEALLTCDADVRPVALEESGFTFTHSTVEEAVASAVPAAR